MSRTSCTWNQSRTDTFRLSSTKILARRGKGGFGTNCQNPSHSSLVTFIPDEGKIFVQADQAGAEAWIVAQLAPRGRYIELFENFIKIHVYVALNLFREVWAAEFGSKQLIDELCNLPISSLKSHPRWKEVDSMIKASDNWEPARRYYYMGKRVAHSSNYGIQANEFRLNVLKDSDGQIALSSTTASKFLALYHQMFPEIHAWQISIQKQLEYGGVLRNLQGYPRRFFRPFTNDLFKKAYCFIPQSTVGTITNIAIANMQDYIESSNLQWDILVNKHDSILAQCPFDDVTKCDEVTKSVLEQDLVTPAGVHFKMRAEVKTGMNWLEMN